MNTSIPAHLIYKYTDTNQLDNTTNITTTTTKRAKNTSISLGVIHANNFTSLAPYTYIYCNKGLKQLDTYDSSIKLDYYVSHTISIFNKAFIKIRKYKYNLALFLTREKCIEYVPLHHSQASYDLNLWLIMIFFNMKYWDENQHILNEMTNLNNIITSMNNLWVDCMPEMLDTIYLNNKRFFLEKNKILAVYEPTIPSYSSVNATIINTIKPTLESTKKKYFFLKNGPKYLTITCNRNQNLISLIKWVCLNLTKHTKLLKRNKTLLSRFYRKKKFNKTHNRFILSNIEIKRIYTSLTITPDGTVSSTPLPKIESGKNIKRLDCVQSLHTLEHLSKQKKQLHSIEYQQLEHESDIIVNFVHFDCECILNCKCGCCCRNWQCVRPIFI